MLSASDIPNSSSFDVPFVAKEKVAISLTSAILF